MRLRLGTVPLVVVALLALQGCTKTVYYAVLAPNQEMAESNGCFQQCQRLHSGQTKHFLSCVDTCPGSRIVKERQCREVEYERDEYGCTTMHAQTLDTAFLVLSIALLVAASVGITVLVASQNSTGPK
jgi:hypothetical protein